MKARFGTRWGWGLAVLAVAGCAAPARLYVNPQADVSFYRKVAVLSFTNLSQQSFAGERVTRAFITELIIAGRFQIVEPADFRMELAKTGGEPDAEGKYDPEKVKQAATRLEVTGIIRGAVSEYTTQRSGQQDMPVVSFDAELIDVATGNVVWRIAVTRKGHGRVPVVGGGSRSFGQVTREACEEAVRSLRGKAL